MLLTHGKYCKLQGVPWFWFQSKLAHHHGTMKSYMNYLPRRSSNACADRAEFLPHARENEHIIDY